MSDLKAAALIRDIPDFPQPGIVFRDITPLLGDHAALAEVVDALAEQARRLAPDLIVGIESRGFLFGTPLALQLGVGFAPIRKLGKLPHVRVTEEYALEYGTNTVEIHHDAVHPGQRVVIVDDVLATGGTAAAAIRLVERLGGIVAGCCFVIELGFLRGRDALPGQDVSSLLVYP